jgi:hypothetical protein
MLFNKKGMETETLVILIVMILLGMGFAYSIWKMVIS